MKCPYCGHTDDKVLDSRSVRDGESIRRRRECLACGRRYTTNEEVEEMRLTVVKKDQRREPFDRGKIRRSMQVACEKRPVSTAQLDVAVESIERALYNRGDKEATSSEIGDMVIERLKQLDRVAYVRFASVYRRFEDVTQFAELVQTIDEPTG